MECGSTGVDVLRSGKNGTENPTLLEIFLVDDDRDADAERQNQRQHVAGDLHDEQHVHGVPRNRKTAPESCVQRRDGDSDHNTASHRKEMQFL